MKRIVSLILAFAMLIGMLPVLATAEDVTSGSCGENLLWTLNENGTLLISGSGAMVDYSYESPAPWIRSSTNIAVVTVVFDGSVTKIGASAFSNLDELESFTIPDTVTEIGDNAFSGCYKLTEITIPEAVTRIGEYAFFNCTAVEKINYRAEAAEEIGTRAFTLVGQDSEETVVTITSNVKIIPDDLFRADTIENGWYPHITDVNFEENSICESIGEDAFYQCIDLKEVDVPQSVKTIEWSAFGSCTNLQNVYYTGTEAQWNNITFGPDNDILGSTTIHFQKTGGSSTDAHEHSFGDWYETKAPTKETEGEERRDCVGCGEYETRIIEKLVSSEKEEIDGSCGDNLTWKFDETTGILTITGTGAMTDFTYRQAPWKDKYSDIISVVITEGVSHIGNTAFAECNNMASIIIPNSVTSIGNGAFYLCQRLTDVKIPEGVTHIAESAFKECTGLTDVIIPSTVTSIGREAFAGCRNLTNAIIPDGVVRIEMGTFWDCSSLMSVKIPSGVVCIEATTFKDCSNLRSVTIPDSIVSIGQQAFEGCSSLTSITIPASVTNIDRYAFNDCSDLTDVYYAASSDEWAKVTIGENNDCLTNAAMHFSGESGCVHSYTPNVTAPTCTEQGYTTYICNCGDSYVDNYVNAAGHSFGDWYVTKEATEESEGEEQRDCSACDHYETRTIEKLPPSEEDTNGGTCGENLTWLLDTDGTLTISGAGKMDEYASASDVPWHKDRERITSLIICEEVASLDKYAFYECTALESIYFKATAMEDLSSSSVAFYRAGVNGNGIEVVVGEGVSQIPAYLFYVSSYSSDASANIVTVNFEGDSVCKSIGDWAFRDCSALASITIPKSVTSIGRYAFYYCFNLLIQFDAMELPKSLGESWDNGAAICLNAKSFGVTEYGQKYWVTNENTVCVWKYDGSDTELVIPETIEGYPVVEIAVSSFSNCTKITSVTIPDNTTTVGSYAFYNCTGLTSITIPKNVTTLGENVFYNCTSVESIYYNSIAMNDFTSSTEPFGFTSPTSDNPDVSLVIGRHVTRIPAYLFYSYYSSHAVPLTTISFEEGSVCESIGVCAFHCSSLTTVTIPNSVKEINTDAFASCKNLTSITFEEGSVCESIGNSAFISSGLTAVTIPGSVQKIQAYAFGSCRNLVSISFCGNVPTIEKNSFSNVTASAYYPNNNDTWTDERLDNYGGTLTWIPYDNPQGIHKHNHSAEITEPTCTDQGYTTYTCSCGDSYVDDYVDSTGHIYGDWYETVAPVQGQLGEEQRDCENCDVYETRTVVSWSFDESTGTLTITGNGAMRNYDSSNQQPWYEYSDSIEAVILEEGVLSIGTESFSKLENVTYVNIPNSVQAIGNGAFNGCTNLEAIYFAGSKLQWNAITVGGNNSGLEQATIFYSTWNGEVDTDFVYSSGAYLISSAAELAGLAKLVNEGRTSGNYRLAADIDLNCSDSLQWVPIGNINNPSYIDLDGDGYTISSLFIGTNEDYQGLFGYAEMGNIENIVLKNALVQGREYIGGIIGYASNYGRTTNIRGCVVEGGEISGTESVGGVIGGYGGPYWGSERTVERCLNSASVVGGESIGGIIGSLYSDASNVTSTKVNLFECANLGNINGSEYVGGIIGKATLINGVQFVFNNCYNHGCISSSDAEADPSGGIAGYLTLRGLGNASKICFYNCHNAGSTVKPTLGDFQWTSSYHKFTTKNSYYLLGSCEPVDVEGLEGLTKSQMKTVSSFENWDFSSIWKIDDTRNHGYPYLQWAEKWVDITEDEKDDSNEVSSTVRYFRKWDADTQTAYWGEEPPVVEGLDLGSQVTEETDTSFLADVDNLVGTHVLAETKTRDDGMIAADILLSIKPLETKTGTITAIGFTTITIDGVEYSIPENVNVYDLNVGDSVMYHLYNGDLVGINGKGSADDDNDDSAENIGTIRYYSVWDVNNNVAQFGPNDHKGLQMTDETDTAFRSDPTKYLGHYVLVESKAGQEGSDRDILIGMKPVETKTGTVTSVDDLDIVIDGTNYTAHEGLGSLLGYANQFVVYHLFDGTLVGIETLEKKEGFLTYWSKEANSINIKFDVNAELPEVYSLSLAADEKTVTLLGETGSRVDSVTFLCDSNGILYQIERKTVIDGDFSYLTSQNTIASYQYHYNEDWFHNSSYNYQHDLTRMSMRVTMAAGDVTAAGKSDGSENIRKMMTELGFEYSDSFSSYPEPTYDSIGYAFGSKEIISPTNEKSTLIMIAVRGSGYGKEWGGNFRVDTEVAHRGFQLAANQVIDSLENYIDANKNTFHPRVKVWISGFSRAAATTNLVAAHLDEGAIEQIDAADVFAFCFECPQNTTKTNANHGLYNNIVNIINPLDIVTKVAMSSWNFGRYGLNYFLPSAETLGETEYSTLKTKMEAEYARILSTNGTEIAALTEEVPGQSDALDHLMDVFAKSVKDRSYYSYNYQETFIKNIGDGLGGGSIELSQITNILISLIELTDSLIPEIIMAGGVNLSSIKFHAHEMPLCLAWLDSIDGLSSIDYKEKRKIFINCPIDVEIYRESTLVGKITNNVPESIENGVATYIDADGQKVVILPTDTEYNIKLNATDNGYMTYTVTEYNLNGNNTERVVSYHNIKLTKGDSLNAIVEDLDEVGKAQYPLALGNGQEAKPTIDQSGAEVKTINVNAEAQLGGAVYGGGAYLNGEFAKVTAVANAGYQFVGWFVDGEMVSTEEEYRLAVTSDVTITAQFKSSGHNHVAGVEWVSDGTHHWHKCTGCDEELDLAIHSGGTATCTKKAVCSVCGASYGELASHDYETSWSQGDANGHWHECKNCSAHDTQVKHTPGAAATETTAQTCTECGYVIAPATGHITHTAGSEWLSDGNSHWHKCTGCNEKLDVTTHSGGTATCTKKAVCSVCGTSYGELASHDYETSWNQGDANGHWHECKNCSAHDTQVRHTPGAAATETTAQFCTVCDYVITPALGHTCTAGSKWYSNGSYHWHVCTSCGAWVKTSYHSYSSDTDETCNVCGYTRTVTATEPTQETEVAMTETTEPTDPGEEVIATETAPTTVPTEANENLSDDAVSEDTDSHDVSSVLITVFAIVALGSLAALAILLVYKKRRESK